jgi:hypothetical protein
MLRRVIVLMYAYDSVEMQDNRGPASSNFIGSAVGAVATSRTMLHVIVGGIALYEVMAIGGEISSKTFLGSWM